MIELESQPGFILFCNFFNSVNKSLAAQIHGCKCNVKFFIYWDIIHLDSIYDWVLTWIVIEKCKRNLSFISSQEE